ncbi:aspartyl/asparaginyl beta-hydroxylase domain-containing protein [Ottowia testudinis]|uniref:Aspartyl/asparaginyl beta-hydroxylase domain-containing protein n=1 Tax=Ottowia testudinis TaxID=2816950 RepID=A0A975H697_9BURK|nr:aspartyl/asparaginyl beta-hydroxylase domain-containing protein [Ottowia testudinis]QTD45782.1 aspartyl/asparaginyl beta-hydroxylase domain-containing protein [Ottowia testudinis]
MTVINARIPLVFRLLHRFEAWLGRHSLCGDAPVLDAAQFGWVPALQAQWQAVAAEYHALLARGEPIPPFQAISPEQRALTTDARWRTFVLYAYGVKAPRNAALCPRTTAAVEAVPGLQTAMFSILEAGKVLPPHRGPYKGLLRVHLALQVPEPAQGCWIEVAGQRLHWREGEVMVFDDTAIHSAANTTRGRRCVLFLDVLRPLPAPADHVNRTLIALVRRSPFGTRAKAVFRRWYAARGIQADV